MNKINKKKPSAKTAKFGTPEWPCENPWTEMSAEQRKKVLALKILPNWILQLDEELTDLGFRIKKLNKLIMGGQTCSSEPQNTLMNAQYLSMVNYLAFLAKRVDLAVHDTLHAAWDKPEAATV